MTRRADPQQIYLARRAATFGNLTRTGVVDELDAEHLISAWERSPEAQALDRLTPEYWQAADAWITAERTAKKTG
jgi:hypothetical protein